MKKQNKFPRQDQRKQQTNEAEVIVEDEVGQEADTGVVQQPEVTTEGDKEVAGGEEGKGESEGESEASLADALAVEGKGAEVDLEKDKVLFETVSLPEGTELPSHLQLIKDYLTEMRPTVPQKDLTAWQVRLHGALGALLELDPQYAIPQMRVVISWLREDANNAFQPAYRARKLEALKLRGAKLREYEALLHTIHTISKCEKRSDFAKFIDWESLRAQFTSGKSDQYTRVLLGVCGY